MNEVTLQTLHWLFSTVAQTYGAVLGLMGLLVVYRLENFSNIRGACKARAEDSINRCFGLLQLDIDAHGLTPDDMNEHWNKKITKEQKDELKKFIPTTHDKVDLEVARIVRHLNWSSLVKWHFGFFVIFHLPLILVSIYGVYSAQKKLALLSGIAHGLLWYILVASSMLIFSFLYSLFDDKIPWKHLWNNKDKRS